MVDARISGEDHYTYSRSRMDRSDMLHLEDDDLIVPPPLAYVEDVIEQKARKSLKEKAKIGKSRMVKFVNDHVPITKWLPDYDCGKKLQGDIVGGVIVGLILICQTMAHAAIATTVTVQGPYCALGPAIMYAIFGTSPHASISSGAVAAVMIADQLSKYGDIEVRTRVASYLALTTGLLIFIFGVTKLTFLVRFLSQPTLSGFISGASLIIAATQSKQLTGLDKHLYNAKGVVPILTGTFANITAVNWAAVAIGLCVMAVLHKSKALKASLKKREETWAKILLQSLDFKELFVVLFFGGLVYSLRTPGAVNDSQETGLVVNVVGPVPQGVPGFTPPWEYVPDSVTFVSLLPGSLLIALTSFITTFSSSRRVALQQGYSIKASQEAIALGIAGITGGFFQSFPVSGSLSRAALLPMLGINSQIGGLVATCVVASGLIFFSSAIFWIPKCVLSGIIILACTNLQDFPYLFWLIKTSKIQEKTKEQVEQVVRRISSREPSPPSSSLKDGLGSPARASASGRAGSSPNLPVMVEMPGALLPDSSPANEDTSNPARNTNNALSPTANVADLKQPLLLNMNIPASQSVNTLTAGLSPRSSPLSVSKSRSGIRRILSSENVGTNGGLNKNLGSLGELTQGGVDADFAEMATEFAEARIKQVPSFQRSALLSPSKERKEGSGTNQSIVQQSGGGGDVQRGSTSDYTINIPKLPTTAVVGFYRDILVWVLACGGTILLGVLQGVALSVALSLFIMISDVVFPRVSQMGKLDEHSSLYDVQRGRKLEITVHQFEGVVIFSFGASMFFANIEFIREEVEKMLQREKQWREIKVIVTVWSQVNSIDATALKELKELFEAWKKRGLSIMAADATGEVLDVLEEHFGKFFDQPKVLLNVEECLFQARFRVHPGALQNNP
ncbi:unnamed protein product [Amoebophrya sp. A120]|nr:unnamed protein product [Amoebophrya sp. A120]|eukprot:GSA120T00020790001.1